MADDRQIPPGSLYTSDSYASQYLPEKCFYQTDARIFHRAGFLYDPLLRIEQAILDPHSLTAAGVLRSGEPATMQIQSIGAGLAGITVRLQFWQGLPAFQATSAMVPDLPGEPPTMHVVESDASYELQLDDYRFRIAKDPFTLAILDGRGQVIFDLETEQVAGDFITPPLGFRRSTAGCEPFLSWKIQNEDRFFGLGEKFNRVEKSGTRATIWSADTGGTNTTDLSYKSVPVLYSTAGWGLMLHSSYRSLWEVGAFSYTAGSLLSEEPQLDLFLFLAPGLKSLLELYTGLTGRPEMPPPWAFGIWMSRCAYTRRAQVEDVLDRLRGEAIPADVVHLDPPWMKTHYYPLLGVDACDFDWDAAAFGDPQELFETFARHGFKTCLWINPYLPEGKPIYETAKQAGYLVKSLSGGTARLEHGQPVGILDFTNPDAKAWWMEKLVRLLRLGAAVFKPDYGDRVPEDALFFNGKTGREMHNLYLHLYAETAYEAARAVHGEGIVWRRAGYIGTQRYPGTWAGDTQVSWPGMRGALRGGLSAGFTGEAFWSHDIGGFVGPAPSPELYIRWAQFGLLSPFARFHGTTPREPWEYGELALEVVRDYAQLRYSLVPYLRAAAAQAVATGLPVLRHMQLEFPDEPNVATLDEQYLLGPDLLAAPVLQAGARRLSVYFPPGQWRSLDDFHEVVDGPGFRNVAAPLARMPLFVRPGAAIPRYLQAPVNLQGSPASELLLELYAGDSCRVLRFNEGVPVEIRYDWKAECGALSISPAPLTFTVRLVGFTAEVRRPGGQTIPVEIRSGTLEFQLAAGDRCSLRR